MSACPFFVRGVGYGDRFDLEIVAGLSAGHTSDAIGARIGISGSFVRSRCRALGHRAAGKPYLQRRDEFQAGLPVQRASNLSQSLRSILSGRRDERPSRLVRAMRQRLFVLDRDGLDPSHGVACLHFAGLTLTEIERLTGVPVPAVIDAVRLHHAPIRAREARP